MLYYVKKNKLSHTKLMYGSSAWWDFASATDRQKLKGPTLYSRWFLYFRSGL